jgi:translation initiation factor 2B subunit (eIF-2B alpha/beta/delta family)
MKTEYLDRANRIATDNVSSAQQVLKDTLDLLIDFCDKNSSEAGFVAELNSIGTALSNAQAQMSALSNICRLITSASERLPVPEIGPYIGVLRRKVGDASARTAMKAAGLIGSGRPYATLSQSEFVLKTFETAAGEGRLATVYVMESRPLFEGRQSARALKSMGHRPILVSDAAIGFFVSRIDAAFVGADAILSDGTLVNKIGSYALAAACSVAKKKFYAITSVLKYDREKDAAHFLNKEESPHEIFPNPEFEVTNVYFDSVAPELVTSVLTEAGSIPPLSGLGSLESAMKELYG